MVLHGFTGSAAAMSPITEALSRRHRVVAVDLVGHGNSAVPRSARRYTLERVLDDLDGLVTGLDLVPLHLLGYSMGGRLALAYAVEKAEKLRSLVLIGASAGLADDAYRAQRRASDDALADRIETDGLEWFVDWWMSRPLLAPKSAAGDAAAGLARHRRLENDARALANTLRGLGTGAMEPLHSHLADLDVPVAVLVGSHDEKFRAIAEGLVAALPQAAKHIVADAGHAVHVDNPGDTAAAILPFFRTVDQEPFFRTVDQEPFFRTVDQEPFFRTVDQEPFFRTVDQEPFFRTVDQEHGL